MKVEGTGSDDVEHSADNLGNSKGNLDGDCDGIYRSIYDTKNGKHRINGDGYFEIHHETAFLFKLHSDIVKADICIGQSCYDRVAASPPRKGDKVHTDNWFNGEAVQFSLALVLNNSPWRNHFSLEPICALEKNYLFESIWTYPLVSTKARVVRPEYKKCLTEKKGITQII